MFGTGRTIVKGKTVEFEYMQIRQEELGGIVFIAKPSGQTEASFKLVSASEREITFENPVHDFPKKVTYRLEKDGSLLATIDRMPSIHPKQSASSTDSGQVMLGFPDLVL